MSGALTIEIIAAGLVTLAATAASGLGWLYRRLTRLETQMAERTAADQGLATQKDVHEVDLALERLNGRLDKHEEADRGLGRSLDELRERVTDLRKAIQRIDDYLRKSGQ